MEPQHAQELLADRTVHILALVLTLLGAAALTRSRITANTPKTNVFAYAIYAVCALTMFTASTLHNWSPEDDKDNWLRALDHAGIFLMIAGTYSPVFLIGIKTADKWWVFSGLWALALTGIALKVVFIGTLEIAFIVLYVVLGWGGLVIITFHSRMRHAFPRPPYILLVTGAAVYSLGIFIFHAETLPFRLAIWHAFVLAAAAIHFVAIWKIHEDATHESFRSG